MDNLERLNLKIGDKMDITVENGRVYRTVLEDTEGGYLLLSTPLFRGVPVIFHQGQEVGLSFFRQTGRFSVSARVQGFKVEGAVRLIVFDAYGQPIKKQLRNSYRLPCDLKGIIRPTINGPFPLNYTQEDYDVEIDARLLDIGEMGLGLVCKTRFETGDRAYVRVYLEWPAPGAEPCSFFAEVMRCEIYERNTNMFRCGMQFIGLDEDTRKHISRFVLVRQQQMLRQQRLVEGE